MAKEKEGYREMIVFLCENKKLPLLVTKREACVAMGISRNYLTKLIIDGKITLDENKIPIGSIARYLCG